MAFITKQSVAFNILNNIQEDSTADYIEKSKPAMVGEIREWKGGKFRKTVNGWEPVQEGGESKKKEEDGNIVDNVNNGEVINSLFKEWNSIKTSEQHEKWAKKVANTKFGTYKDKTILNVMGDFNPKFPNEIIKKDFINEVQEAYKNGWEPVKEGSQADKEQKESKGSLSPSTKRYRDNFMELLTTTSSKLSDPKKVTVEATPKGNWRVYYDGKSTSLVVGGDKLPESAIRELQWEHHDEEVKEKDNGSSFQKEIKEDIKDKLKSLEGKKGKDFKGNEGKIMSAFLAENVKGFLNPKDKIKDDEILVTFKRDSDGKVIFQNYTRKEVTI